jgi:hypothetical protein
MPDYGADTRRPRGLHAGCSIDAPDGGVDVITAHSVLEGDDTALEREVELIPGREFAWGASGRRLRNVEVCVSAMPISLLGLHFRRALCMMVPSCRRRPTRITPWTPRDSMDTA